MPKNPKYPFINRILSKREKIESGVVEDLLLEITQERDLLEVIFDSMAEGVIAADRNGQVIFFNAVAETIFGMDGQIQHGADVIEAMPPGALKNLVSDALANEERIYEAEVAIETPVERILRINMIPLIDRLERFFGTVILGIDVTEKSRAETRLREAEKLAARTTISAGIAHEVRNPLNSLSIHLQLAEKQLENLRRDWKPGNPVDPSRLLPCTEKIEDNLKIIREEVDRLDKVVQNFLLAVRPQKPNWSFVPVEQLVTSALRLLEPDFSQNDIRILFEPLDEDLIVPVDEYQIRQALLNILRNAVEAISADETGQIRVRLRKFPDRVRIEVIDSGEGIPPENRKKMFDPYFTTRATGTGLGLSIVERVIREHQGRIAIQSEPGQGTCVSLDLPLSAEHTIQIPILEDQEEGAVHP